MRQEYQFRQKPWREWIFGSCALRAHRSFDAFSSSLAFLGDSGPSGVSSAGCRTQIRAKASWGTILGAAPPLLTIPWKRTGFAILF